MAFEDHDHKVSWNLEYSFFSGFGKTQLDLDELSVC